MVHIWYVDSHLVRRGQMRTQPARAAAQGEERLHAADALKSSRHRFHTGHTPASAAAPVDLTVADAFHSISGGDGDDHSGGAQISRVAY